VLSVISWIGSLAKDQNDPRNHTNGHEEVNQ
jgi:hypothetical protein